MFERSQRRRGGGSAAAILTFGVLAASVAAAAPAHAGAACQPAIQTVVLSTGGLPDDGMPPLPGPTNPDGAS